MGKYLDDAGLSHLWGKIKAYVAANSGGSIGPGDVTFDKLENPMVQDGVFTWDCGGGDLHVENGCVSLPETTFEGHCQIESSVIFNSYERPIFTAEPDFQTPLGSGSLADGAVTTAKIADLSVTTEKIAFGSIGAGKMMDDTVTAAKLKADSVTTPKIADAAVTMAKLAQDVRDAMGGSGGSPLDAYPVGAIYLSMSATSPQALFGGTWSKLEGRFLMCSDSSHAAGATGGSNDAVVVSHAHSGESDTDGSHTHSISGGSHSHSGSTSSAGSHSHTTGIGSQSFVTSSGSFGYGSGGSTAPAPSSKTSATASSGSHSHSVTVNTSSSHSHSMTSAGGHYHNLTIDSAGQSGTNKNMPKYIAVNAWQRTA